MRSVLNIQSLDFVQFRAGRKLPSKIFFYREVGADRRYMNWKRMHSDYLEHSNHPIWFVKGRRQCRLKVNRLMDRKGAFAADVESDIISCAFS